MKELFYTKTTAFTELKPSFKWVSDGFCLRFKHLMNVCLVSSFALCSLALKAQDCTTLYVITSDNGNVYSLNTATGAKTLVTTMTTGIENLAVGPNPASLGTTVFTTSQVASGSTVFKTNASISTTLPAAVYGLTANPATTGATAGFVYGISAAKQLIQASPATATIVGTITGDAVWSGSTMTGDGFFNSSGELMTIVTSGSNS